MKRLSLYSIYLGLSYLTLSGYAYAQGTLNLTGSIQDSTCALSQESNDITVTLGPTTSKQFITKGDVSQPKDFAIKLENCGKDVKSVRVTFSGTPDPQDSSVIAVDAGGATGVGVQILDKNMSPIKLTEASLPYSITPNSSTVTLNFNARYIATHLPVTEGIANASGTFVFLYD